MRISIQLLLRYDREREVESDSECEDGQQQRDEEFQESAMECEQVLDQLGPLRRRVAEVHSFNCKPIACLIM